MADVVTVIATALEAAPIGWQLFVLESGKSDSIAFLLLLATYATRLLAQALSWCSVCKIARETKREPTMPINPPTIAPWTASLRPQTPYATTGGALWPPEHLL